MNKKSFSQFVQLKPLTLVLSSQLLVTSAIFCKRLRRKELNDLVPSPFLSC